MTFGGETTTPPVTNPFGHDKSSTIRARTVAPMPLPPIFAESRLRVAAGNAVLLPPQL
jgi:hypothetical protein